MERFYIYDSQALPAGFTGGSSARMGHDVSIVHTGNMKTVNYTVSNFKEVSPILSHFVNSNLIAAFPLLMDNYGGLCLETPEQKLKCFAKLLWSVDSMSKILSHSSTPVSKASLYYIAKYPDFSQMFYTPEQYIFLDPYDEDRIVADNTVRRYFYVKWGYVEGTSIPLAVDKIVTVVNLIRVAGVAKNLRLMIMQRALQIMKERSRSFEDKSFFDISNESYDAHIASLEKMKVSDGAELNCYDSEVLYHNSSVNSYLRFIVSQMLPFTRLIFGHAQWDVFSTKSLTRYEALSHAIKWLSGYYVYEYTRYVLNAYSVKHSHDYQRYMDHHRKKLNFYNFSDYKDVIVGSMVLCGLSLMMSIMGWVAISPNMALGCLLIVVAVCFFKDPDLGHYSSERGMILTAPMCIELIWRVVLKSFAPVCSILFAELCILGNAVIIPGQFIRKLALRDEPTTFLDRNRYIYTSSPSRYRAGHLDILLTLGECYLLGNIYLAIGPFLLVIPALATGVYLLFNTVTSVLPLLIKQCKHHIRLTGNHLSYRKACFLSLKLACGSKLETCNASSPGSILRPGV